MARYRKIHPRIHGDEKLAKADQLYQLLWFKLLTHPALKPCGAGVFDFGTLDGFMGNEGPFCYRCQGMCEAEGDAHNARGALAFFEAEGMLFVDGPLLIVKNFLLYNCPDNRNHLAGWIEWCEELPRSAAWQKLLDHLRAQSPALPEWLFTGLLEPLARGQIRGLRSHFDSRTEEPKNHKGNHAGDHPPMAPQDHPPILELELEQELELKKRKKRSRVTNGNGKPTKSQAQAQVLDRHREAAAVLWGLQENLRAEIPRTRKLEATDARLTRIAERLEEGATPADCEHVISVYHFEAKNKGSAEWFNGDTNWRRDNFERALGKPLGRGPPMAGYHKVTGAESYEPGDTKL